MDCERCAGMGGGWVRFGMDSTDYDFEECPRCDGTGRARHLRLGPDDYLVMPCSVHIMRYMGLNDDDKKYWRIACGTLITREDWHYITSYQDVLDYDLAVCGNCARTLPKEIL